MKPTIINFPNQTKITKINPTDQNKIQKPNQNQKPKSKNKIQTKIQTKIQQTKPKFNRPNQNPTDQTKMSKLQHQKLNLFAKLSNLNHARQSK